MILHTETSKLMYNRSFLFEVLHQPTLLPSTFNYHDMFFIQGLPSCGLNAALQSQNTHFENNALKLIKLGEKLNFF